MRSIRVSLVAYFLLLMSLGLGAFAFFMHESSRERLSAIHRANEATLSEQNRQLQGLNLESYLRTEQTLLAAFDEKLLGKAQSLANHLARRTRPFSDPENTARRWAARHVAAIHTQLQALNAASPLLLGLQCQLQDCARNFSSRRLLTTGELQFVEEVVPSSEGPQSAGFFQILSDQGEPLLTSPSIAPHDLRLDDLDVHMPLFRWNFDTVEMPDKRRVRLITLKVPVVRMTFLWEQPGRSRGANPGRRQRSVLQPTDLDEIEQAPVVYIQYGRFTSEMDETLAELRADVETNRATLDRELKANLEQLDRESQASLASLRTRLLIISLITFGITVLGGVWLVHRVLKPVQRISHAVSEVTEKDFQLRLKKGEVPEELEPIVERLKQSLASLGAAFAREKQAAADISHELRTPISALLATAQVCLRKERSSEEYRAALQNCREIGQQLSVLVERLLTLARLDAGADKLRPESVDVPELAEQCVQMVRPLAESRELSLTLERNGALVVYTDPEKLREVLINLLHNAIQYNRPRGKIDVGVCQSNGHVALSVRDTGIGIAAEAKSHLFERFYRADPSRQSDTVQAGLGLAIVKGYLDLMGGKIEVDSSAGKGSTFRVLLPLSPSKST
jgi:heavy metal sensor kinase